MASCLTDISLENGYAEAPIIYGNETIQGVGGGVCQVSALSFRTAFMGVSPCGAACACLPRGLLQSKRLVTCM